MQITKTENGYNLELEDGTKMSVAADNTSSRHWQMIQDAIADGVKVHEPPEPDPEEVLKAQRQEMRVRRFQAKAALMQVGLLEAAEAAVNAAGPLTQLAWKEEETFARLSPTIVQLANTLKLTDEQVDDLFRLAATIAV